MLKTVHESADNTAFFYILYFFPKDPYWEADNVKADIEDRVHTQEWQLFYEDEGLQDTIHFSSIAPWAK